MNFIHYLYIKGETTFSSKLGGRGLIIVPIWYSSVVMSTPILPVGIGRFKFFLLEFCWLCVLIGISYLIIPKKQVHIHSESWMIRYGTMTSLWAYLYLLLPMGLVLLYLILS